MIESMMRMIGHKVQVARYATTVDIEVTTIGLLGLTMSKSILR